MRKTLKSSRREQTMNATKRFAARSGLVVCSALVVALTGCRTQVVHEHTRTVYVPAPPPVVTPPPPVVVVPPPASPPPPAINVPPAPQPPPPVIVVAPPESQPVVLIQSEHDFYEPLTAYGRWVVVGDYGRCWIPARVETGWRPYANGYWQRTDAGWYWASEEPWGWATYHYGRWDFTTQFGWIWVPQTQWAPAWVSWREGGGYVGWAPLRPSVTLNVHIGTPVREPAFESRAFVFVEHRRMLEPIRPKTVVVNNTTIINQTVNITNVKVGNKTVMNEGPRPELIERESGRKVPAVPVREFRRREEASVIARQRNIPTVAEGKRQPPARIESQPVEKNTSHAPVARQVEKPAVFVSPPPQPVATPARPTPPRPAQNETRHEIETAKKNTPTPTVEPQGKPEVGSAPTLPSRREARPVASPTVTAKPAPQPITPNPIRDEQKREPTVEKKNPATSPAVQAEPRREVRSAAKPAAASPVQVEAAPQAAVKRPTAPPSQRPDQKRVISPKEKSQAAEQVEPDKKKQDDRGAAPADSTRPPR
jgi:hypothetical protein